MTKQNPGPEGLHERVPRTTSHALLDLRPMWWNPFLTLSAVLLDISPKGFKIELVENASLRPNSRVTLKIPLAPFGMKRPRHLVVRGHLRWFDSDSRKAGGEFTALKASQETIVQRILEGLQLHQLR